MESLTLVQVEQEAFRVCMDCTTRAVAANKFAGEPGSVATGPNGLECARGLDCALPRRLREITAASRTDGQQQRLIDEMPSSWMWNCIPEAQPEVPGAAAPATPEAPADTASKKSK